MKQQTGSAAFVDAEEFRRQGYTNVNRILQRIPGVYVREEDGYGNFINISIRGADGTRSEKVTIMEDGILSAPAPYSAPAAYYNPKTARMAGIEVLKGSSQVRYGPHTTGGVINFLSTPVPEERSGYLRYTFGSDNTQLIHGWYGDVFETDFGKFGFVAEWHGQSTDGYRSIPGVDQDTGFDLYEPMLKIYWEPKTSFEQRFEFKVGYTDFDADESYLGLAESDLDRNPYSRYLGSALDNFDSDHLRLYLRWTGRPTDNLSLESTAYYNRFNRNWFRIDHVGTTQNPAVDSRGRIVGRSDLHLALLENGNAFLPVLRGDAPGAYGIRASNRSYASLGIQNAATYTLSTGPVDHALTGGFRFHHDYVDRFQWVDIYNTDGNGNLTLARSGTPGDESDRRQETTAASIFLQDEVTWNKLKVVPGVRFEFLDYDLNERGVGESGNLDTWAAGISASYELTDESLLFGGIHRGISTPGPAEFFSRGIEVEESIGYELGIRHSKEDYFYAELVGFLTDFENLVGTDAGLGAALSNSVNAGEATTWGFEGTVSYDYAAQKGWGFGLPAYFNATFTSAELESALSSGGGDGIFAGGTAGADIPYVPAWTLAAGIALQYEKFAFNVDAIWVDETFGTAANLDGPVTTSRQGKTDSYFLLDLSASYAINKYLTILGGIQNVFDTEYVSSRLPEGPRVGAPRSLYAGFETRF
ncbi:MAG: TonB-dependent receptor [Verrucomicrobiota bacterium]